MAVCDFKSPSSTDQAMNADLGCMLFAAIEVNIKHVTLLALPSEIGSDLCQKMVKSCSAYGCTNRFSRNSILFHKFPLKDKGIDLKEFSILERFFYFI